jgi:hypothetical protein
MLADGPMLALLLRLSPLSPFVVTNVLLSLTSISHTTYLWTTLVGVTPGSLPYAYAARLGASLYDEFPPRDPLVLCTAVVGLVASVLMAWKVGSIASEALQRLDEPAAAKAPRGPVAPLRALRRGAAPSEREPLTRQRSPARAPYVDTSALGGVSCTLCSAKPRCSA